MDKTILITGCSSGIGLDAARTLKARGWRVFAACRHAQDCARLSDEGFESPRIDYTDTASIVSGLTEVLEATGGRLDALFNNGAHGQLAAVEDLPTDALRAIFEANLFGWHELTRHVIPVMRAQGHGRIVQCSSGLGMAAIKWRGAYTATKFALEGLSDTMRLELRGTGVHVVLIEPGPIATDFRINGRAHFERWIDWRASPHSDAYRDTLIPRLYDETGKREAFELGPDAVSAKLVRALETRRPRARYFVTTPTYAMAWAKRLLPGRWLDALIARI
ncbi:MAG: SDR family NAD(P)-dependent oxidoreductase [Pseudooceanicola sp.]